MGIGYSLVLMGLLLAAGVSAVLAMLIQQGRGISGERAIRWRRWHRVSGYLFALVFLGAVIGMWDRLPMVRTGGCLSILHVFLAVIMAPMLVVKIAMARWFKRMHPQLVGLGLALFFLSVTLVVVPVLAPRVLPEAETAAVVDATKAPQDAAAMEALLKDRCARCHTLEKVESAEKTPAAWRETIARMQGYAGDPEFLTPAEADALAGFLAAGTANR